MKQDPIDLAELELLAIGAAKAAGALIVDERPDDLGVSAKSSPTDAVTVMDQRSQDLLVHYFADRRPLDGVYGEEEGGKRSRSGITWVVDPIDGTVNYLYGNPAYAVSVAAVRGDPATRGSWTPIAGAVYNPVSGELFHAHEGGGARLTVGVSSRPLSVRHPEHLGMALVGTGFGYAAERREAEAAALVEILPRIRDIRREGSAALDLCRVACGRLDAHYEVGLHVWDMAAGLLVAREAGAVAGGLVDEHPSHDLAWVSAPSVAQDLAELVRRVTLAGGTYQS